MNQLFSTQEHFVATADPLPLRRSHVSAMFANALDALGEALRTQHEDGLRRAAGVAPRLMSAIGTPV